MTTMSVNGASNGSSGESLIRKAARRLRHISENDVTPELREKAGFALLDYFGAIATGLQAPWASHLVKYARSRRGVCEAHAWGLQEDIAAETAAFTNAALAHR